MTSPTPEPPPARPPGPVTELLDRSRRGEGDALRSLIGVVYDELRAIAGRQRANGPAFETLDTRALVHETFLKLVGADGPPFVDRGHFFATAATAMRQLLVDYARARTAQKRGGGLQPVTLEASLVADRARPELVLEINEVLEQLGAESPELVQVVECRYFAGLSEAEAADALGVSERTIRRRWTKARLWLHRALADG